MGCEMFWSWLFLILVTMNTFTVVASVFFTHNTKDLVNGLTWTGLALIMLALQIQTK